MSLLPGADEATRSDCRCERIHYLHGQWKPLGRFLDFVSTCGRGCRRSADVSKAYSRHAVPSYCRQCEKRCRARHRALDVTWNPGFALPLLARRRPGDDLGMKSSETGRPRHEPHFPVQTLLRPDEGIIVKLD